MRLGRCIGNFVRIDDATLCASRGKYTRMCVEVDLTEPLLVKFQLRRRIERIEYEGMHLVCFECGYYGHRGDICGVSKETDYAYSPIVEVEANGSGLKCGTIALDKDDGVGIQWMFRQKLSTV